jgi:hypothetical protein
MQFRPLTAMTTTVNLIGEGAKQPTCGAAGHLLAYGADLAKVVTRRAAAQ